MVTNKVARIFQYGSNLSSLRINAPARMAGSARAICMAQTQELFELDFTVKSIWNECAAADIVPSVSGRRVWGMVYEIPDMLLTRDRAKPVQRLSFDEIEGEGEQYKRITIDLLDSVGESLEQPVFTYVVINKEFIHQTNSEYAKFMLDGLYEFGFDDSYIAYVEHRIISNNPLLEDQVKAYSNKLRQANV